MHEHLKKRDQVRQITRSVIETFGALQPKLEHFATTPLPDRASVIRILDDLPKSFTRANGRKCRELEYRILRRGSARLTTRGSLRKLSESGPRESTTDMRSLSRIAEEQSPFFLRKL
jgi:hypothetical protein